MTTERIASAIEAELERLYPPDNWESGEHPATTGSAFVRSLAGSRLKSAGPSDENADAFRVDELAAHLVLAAALVTSAFHTVSAAQRVAPGRWGDDLTESTLEALSARGTRYLESVELPQARTALDRAQQILSEEVEALGAHGRRGGGDLEQGALELVGVLREGLVPQGGISLRGADVRLLAEVAWCFVLRGTSVYPGWTDSLLQLMLGAHGRGEPSPARPLYPPRRPRPLFADLTAAPNAISELFEPPTRRSWESWQRRDPQPSERIEFYRACAELLWNQNAARQRAGAEENLPPVAAYVTSFDLELEMALWETARASPTAAGFSVLVPVYVGRDVEPDAVRMEGNSVPPDDFVWLRADVQPSREVGSSDEALRAILSPQTWRLAHDRPGRAGLEEYPWPTVVHLSGAPLLRLPDLTRPEHRSLVNDLRNVRVYDADKPGTKLHHAITIDEYVAIRQSQFEEEWHSLKGEHDGIGAQYLRRLIPERLRVGGRARRFWLALGVPVADAAIRSRFISQLTVRRHAGSQGPTAPVTPPTEVANGRTVGGTELELDEWGAPLEDPPPLRPEGSVEDVSVDDEGEDRHSAVAGLAVNRRIDGEEAALLNSLGLDVLREDVRHVIKPLRHYIAHLAAEQPNESRPSRHNACPLEV